jgi:ABC transporter substrate binding protein
VSVSWHRVHLRPLGSPGPSRSRCGLGYVEGQNLILEYRYAEGRNERFPGLAADLVALKPDVIVADSTPAALAAKRATTAIPIVFVNVSDPVGNRIVQSDPLQMARLQLERSDESRRRRRTSGALSFLVTRRIRDSPGAPANARSST